MTTNDTPIMLSEAEAANIDIKPLPPRDISILLDLKTFQGMTDEEIQMIIDYKIKYALSDKDIKLKQATYIEKMNSDIALSTQVANEANDIYRDILGKSLKLETVGVSNE